jgi:Putative MetA-pathway of phenol degradation
MKIYKVLFLLLFATNSFAQYTDIINSNRPSESMSAFAVGRTVIQLESGLGYINENYNEIDYKANGFLADLTARYGFFKEYLEAIAEVSYQKDTQEFSSNSKNRSGVKATTLGVKYLIFDPFKNPDETVDLYSWKNNNKFKFSQLIPIFAVYGGMNFNFSANEFQISDKKLEIISPKIMAITQNIFGKQYVFITNTFFDKIGTEAQNVGYLLTLTKGFSEKWSAFIENKGIYGKGFSDSFLSGGGAYLLNSNLQVDASVSKNFKNSPSTLYVGIGVSWRSDSNYKDFLVATPEKSKELKDKENRKKKKKNNEKKILDKLPSPSKDGE